MVARKKKTQQEREQEAQRRKEFRRPPGQKRKFFGGGQEFKTKEDFDAFKAELKGEGRTTGKGSPELQEALAAQGVVTTQKTKELGVQLRKNIEEGAAAIEEQFPEIPVARLPTAEDLQAEELAGEQPGLIGRGIQAGQDIFQGRATIGGIPTGIEATGVPGEQISAGAAPALGPGGVIAGGAAAIKATQAANAARLGKVIKQTGVIIAKFSKKLSNPLFLYAAYNEGGKALDLKGTVSDSQGALNTNRGILVDIAQKLGANPPEITLDTAILRAKNLAAQNDKFIRDARKAASISIGGGLFKQTRTLEADIGEYAIELQDLLNILQAAQREQQIQQFRIATQQRKTFADLQVPLPPGVGENDN